MGKIETLINEMLNNLEDCLDDAKKFDNGNKSAGVRVRKTMQEIKTSAQTVRETVSEIKNAEK
jgi:hypothetical protein